MEREKYLFFLLYGSLLYIQIAAKSNPPLPRETKHVCSNLLHSVRYIFGLRIRYTTAVINNVF